MARTKRANVAQGDSTPPPSPKRQKPSKASPKPKKFKPKVQQSEPPVARSRGRGVIIQEPTQTPSMTKKTPEGKGKGKEKDADQHGREGDIQGKETRKGWRGSTSVQATESVGASPSEQPSASEAANPPPNFNTNPIRVINPSVFESEYGRRAFCPVVYVNLNELQRECNLDLSPYLRQYEPLLSIRASYCPKMVKLFYYNMEITDVLDGNNVVEERIDTIVRGQRVRLSADIINTILGIYETPSNVPRQFSAEEIHQILRPGEPIGPLKFSPAALNDTFRAVFYIYSRCIVNKYRNFTHITSKDFPMLASILSREERNLGDIIFQEMKRFRFNSSPSTTIPYPHLVSYMLSIYNIWHLIPGEPTVKIPKFGKVQLHRMGIESSNTGAEAPRKSHTKRQGQKKKNEPASPRAEPSVSRPDQGESSRAASPGPSFLGATLQTYVQDSVRAAIDEMKRHNDEAIAALRRTNTLLTEQVELQVRGLIQAVNDNFMEIYDMEKAQNERLERIENLMRIHFGASIPEAPPVNPPRPFVDPQNPSGSRVVIPGFHTPTTTTPGFHTPTTATPTPYTVTSTSTCHPPTDTVGGPSHKSPSHQSHSTSSTKEILITDQPSPSDIPINRQVHPTPVLSSSAGPIPPSAPPPPSDLPVPPALSLTPEADKKADQISGGSDL